ncbi:MAG: caspase family protein, partial [Armatimonadaceae bacterium]
MDRRTLLLGTLGIGPLGIGPLGSLATAGTLAGPASAQDATGKPDTAKGLKIVPRSGPLAGEPLYTNSHAVLIGISKYQHLSSDKQLKYARKDAEDVRALLVKSFGFPESNITLLVDEGATKRSIETAIGRLNRTLATDRVLIFFSGHGMSVRGSDGDIGMLVPFDANVNLSGTTADGVTDCILMNSVWELLDLAPAKHRLLIADACFSGLLAKPRALEPFSPESLKLLTTQKALQAITASGKAEISKESDGFRNGIFTRKFLDVLEEMAGAPGQVL